MVGAKKSRWKKKQGREKRGVLARFLIACELNASFLCVVD
jgi:hypothetical protein